MSRRAGRRPPRLDPSPPPPRARDEPSLRHRLVRAGVTGRVRAPTITELDIQVRRLVAGDPRTLFGLDRFRGLTTTAVLDAVAWTWGWSRPRPALHDVVVDPDLTLARLVDVVSRLRDVAVAGGRVCFATARPASLLVVHRALATLAAGAGAAVAAAAESGSFRDGGAPGRRVWWVDGVAVVTDGVSLVPAYDPVAFDEMLFELGHRPDLLVADGVFAGAGARVGLEVLALAGPAEPALGVAASLGMLAVVPLDDSRPPSAYEPVVEAATAVFRPHAENTCNTDPAGVTHHTTHAGHQESPGVPSAWRTELWGDR